VQEHPEGARASVRCSTNTAFLPHGTHVPTTTSSSHFDVSGILRNVVRTVIVFRARASGGNNMKSVEDLDVFQLALKDDLNEAQRWNGWNDWN
jgi:hypothetical protein